jgi:hypothetical protein
MGAYDQIDYPGKANLVNTYNDNASLRMYS